MYIPFAEHESLLNLCVFYGCMYNRIIYASQDFADVLTSVPTGINGHSCEEGITMHMQWALDLSKLLHIGSGRIKQAAVPKPKESQSLKCKILPDDFIPSTSGAATQTHPVKKKKTTTKQKHSDGGVIADDARKDPYYQPGGDDEEEEEEEEEEGGGGGGGGGGAEQVVKVVDEYDDASIGADGRQPAEEISDSHGSEEST